jgi:hypothetical protein
MNRLDRRFAIAVSFPGERRRFVKAVVNRLAEVLGSDRVFYDEWYEAELVGIDADLKLRKYYRDESELVVPFFSEHYQKPWCKIEWHAIRAMLKERRAEDAVVPVEMDNTRITGWEAIDFAIRKKRRSGKEIAELILKAYYLRHPQSRSDKVLTNDDGTKSIEPVIAAVEATGSNARKSRVPQDRTQNENLIWRLIDDIRHARRHFEYDDLSTAIADLQRSFDQSHGIWSRTLRVEALLIFAEEERSKINRSRLNEQAFDDTYLRQLLSELQNADG